MHIYIYKNKNVFTDHQQVALSNSSKHALIIEDVRCPEQGQGFVKDQPFQGCNHRHHISQGEAMVGAACFKQGLYKCRGLVLQDVDFMNFWDIRLVSMRIQALNQPTMLLHEVVVHQISHTPWTKAPNLILGRAWKVCHTRASMCPARLVEASSPSSKACMALCKPAWMGILNLPWYESQLRSSEKIFLGNLWG